MNEIQLNDVFQILAEASDDKPWKTATSIAKGLGTGVDRVDVEQALLAYYQRCTETGERPQVRYSSLPSRRTLEVLWGDLRKVGARRLANFTKDDVADDALTQDDRGDNPLVEFGDLSRPNVFVSHSHRDYREVMRIAQFLVEKEVIPWLAETHIEQAEHIHEQIIGALDGSQAFLVFLSPNALASCWTGKEYGDAHRRGIPIFVVADIDSEEIAEILAHKYGNGPLNSAYLRRLDGSARVFVDCLLTDDGHIVHPFAYSNGEITEDRIAHLPSVRPWTELPAALYTQWKQRKAKDH